MENSNTKMDDAATENEIMEKVPPSKDTQTALNFPFLKDCGPDPLNAAHYFNLTLGASMARNGDESHLKTLKQMFPTWFDPDYFTKQRMSNTLSVSSTNLSSSDLGFFSASSTNLMPEGDVISTTRGSTGNIQESSFSTITTPISPASSSVHLSELPTPRLSYHSISSPRHKSSPQETHGDSKSSIQENDEFRVHAPLTSGRLSHEEISDSLPQYCHTDKEINNHNQCYVNKDLQLACCSENNIRHEIQDFKINSPDHKTDGRRTGTSLVDSGKNTKVLWRKVTTAGTFLRSYSKNKSADLSRQQNRSRPMRSQSSVNFTTPAIIATSPPCNQSGPANTRERRKSCAVSQPARRLSAVNRLLSDVTDVPEKRRLSGLLQRRRRSSRRTSDISVFVDENKSYRVRGLALQRFRRIVRVIQIITTVCWRLKSYVREIDSTDWSFVELYLHLQNDISPDLFFDPNQFSKIEPPKGGRRLERLLTIPPHLRTPDHIQQILAFVRTHDTFQHFPTDAQVKFCQVMQYQSYDPRMVILKQGHPPSCFYLILSGTLMVNVRQINPATGQSFVQTVGMMHRGECFGEIALLEGRLRTATVVCKSRTELLVIYKQDFDRIVRKPLLDQRDDNINFCISHNLFEEFSREVFYANPGHFFYQFFPKDTVIAKNSNECPFLILVKSGECQLLGSYKKYDSANKKHAFISRDVETLFPLYTDMIKAESTKIQDPTTKQESVSAITSALESTLLNEHRQGKLIAKPITKPVVEEVPSKARSFSKHRSKTLSNVFDQFEKDKRISMDIPDTPPSPDLDNYWSSKFCGPQSKLTASRVSQSKAKESKLWRVLYEDAKEYVQVATLKQGYVFGLEMLAGLDAPSLTVVSGGVECILVSKQLFLTHANIKSLRVAGDLVTTFPPSSLLRQQISTNRKWRHYKKKLVTTVTSNA